jgi:ABC-type Fe3+ transport system permease subunit
MTNDHTSHNLLRAIALTEWILVFPGALFMTALFVRNIQPAPYEPAQSARRLVEWYATHGRVGLEVFLIALPFTAFVIGCITAARRWMSDAALRQATSETLAAVHAHLATLLIAAATLTAGGILAIVAVHMVAD